MRFPDFFIVGAPKCGTTSLYEYLKPHPGIFMPFPKEPNFYCPDIQYVRRVGGRDEYLKLFEDAPASAIWGEGSTFYLYSRSAVGDLLKDSPSARLVVCLRNPVDMFLSYHGQVLFGRRENIEDPEKAWRAHNGEPADEGVLPRLDYGAICSLGRQVERLLTSAGRAQVHFVLFDEIMTKAKATYEDVLRFLEISSDGRTEFPVYHHRKQHRFPVVAKFFKDPPFPFGHIKRGLRSVFTAAGQEPPHLYHELLTSKGQKPALRPEFRRDLVSYFSDDVRLLESLIGRDLSAWRE